MKAKLTLLLLCLLVLSYAQNECAESRLQKLQTGEILLNPNDLGNAGTNKNFYEMLDRGSFVKDDYLAYAFAIAGFEAACSQTFYSLVVDTVNIEAENTKMKIIVSFLNKAGDTMTTWTKVKLTYLVVSSLRKVTAASPGEIWAVNQNIILTGDVNGAPVLNDEIFTGLNSYTNCGLSYTAGDGFNFGIECQDATGSIADIAVHTYIMGFQYEPDTKAQTQYIAATIVLGDMSTADLKETASYTTAQNVGVAPRAIPSVYGSGVQFDYTNANVGPNSVGGPRLTIKYYGGQLRSIKIAVVLTRIMPISGANVKRNGLESTNTYSYSGIYYPLASSAQYNTALLIDDVTTANFNNLHEKLPVAKYRIYGFSSFKINDGSSCTSMSLDVTINTPNSLTVTLNNKDYFTSIIVQGDIYFPPARSTCTPGVQFTKMFFDLSTLPVPLPTADLAAARAGTITNLKYIKTRISQKFQTVPSDITQQSISQSNDNPLNLIFLVNGKLADTTVVRLNAEVIMSGLTDGKAYGVRVILLPSNTPAGNFIVPANSLNYEFAVSVNGNTLYKKSYTAPQLDSIASAIGAADNTLKSQFHYGINIKGTTATFQYTLLIPRPNVDNTLYTFNVEVDLFEFGQIYDPVTQCCVTKCPANTGLDVTVTPAVCVTCDLAKGLTFDSASSSCKCADGFYLNAALQFQCFPCQAKLCSVCSATNTAVCTTCLTGASLNPLDNTCGCTAGFFENNGVCTACPSKCATCKSSLVCDTCADSKRDIANGCACVAGFFDSGIDKCQTCNSNCATCSSASTCLTCDSRKFRVPKGGACVCDDGYFEIIYQDGTRECKPCSAECKTCSQSASECLTCDSTINRLEGYDSLGHKTCICKAGYNSKTGGSCVQSNCDSDKFCTECQKDLKLCVKCDSTLNRVIKLPEYVCNCADGFYQDPTSKTCKACSSGCAKCSSPTVCNTCVAQASGNANGQCTCQVGTFFTVSTNGVRFCSKCIKYCDKCTDSLTCSTCQSGFALSADNTCVCPLRNFINAAGQCVPCKSGCEICVTDKTCSKCVSPLVVQQNECLSQCSPGYFLSGTTCIGCPNNCAACTATNQCFYCKDKFYLHEGTCYASCPSGTVAEQNTMKCIPCNSPCRTCTNHPSTCTSCEPGEGYLQITGTNQQCVKQCTDGTYPKDNVCQVCDFRCAKCLGASNNCIACPTGRFLYNGACWDSCPGVTVNGTCVSSCPAGFYKQNNQECKKCSTQCETCDKADTCLTCANNFLSRDGKCVASCGDGFYVFRGICVACDKSCKNCQQNPLKCTECASGYVLSGTGRCVSTCGSGFYLDNVSKSCRACSSTCKTCSTESNCLTCPNEKIIPIAGQCRSCNYPCNTCSADLSVCNTCLDGFYLSNGQCVATCPNGLRPINGACSCGSGVFLNGACIAACPKGYTNVGSDCKRCESPCSECAGSSTFCTDCLDTFTLRPNLGTCSATSNCNYGQEQINGKCETICDDNFYYLSNACIFGGCPSGFKQNGFGGCVTADTNTNRCESPTFKLNTACIASCGDKFYPSFSTRTCESCSSNCQSCLDKNFCITCSTGFTVSEGRCVAQSKCAANQVSYSGNCVATCPIGTSLNNGICIRSCPAGTFYFSLFCYKTCPVEAQNFTDNACVSTCPSGTTLIDKVCTNLL